MRIATIALIVGLFLPAIAMAQQQPPQPQDPNPIDWNRARELYQREKQGGKLTPDEQAYLDRAKAIRQKQGAGGGEQRPQAPAARPSTGLPAISNKSEEKYKGQTLGFYGDGRNAPPAEHARRAAEAAAQVRPLSVDGKPDPAGKIAMMSMGMSNTTQEFSRFVQLANQDPSKSKALVIVDAAQGGQDADAWVNPQKRERVWQNAEQRLKALGVTDAQVQVVFLKQALIGPARLGEFPRHAEVLRDDIAAGLKLARERFPNLKLAYLSSRTYAGWAATGLNPEPYAYESAYSVRWVIESQMKGQDKDLAYEKFPVILWGPYLWTDGTKGREQDKLVWEQADTARDGTHPSDTGRDKIGRLLLDFFKTDPTAKPWFCAP